MTDSTGLHQYEFDRVLRCMICARCGAAMSAAIPLCPGKKPPNLTAVGVQSTQEKSPQ